MSRIYGFLSLMLGVTLAAGCGPPEPGQTPDDLQQQILVMKVRSLLRYMPDPADLRPEARRIIDDIVRYGRPPEPPGISTLAAFSGPPKTIKIWRRSLGGASSCDSASQIDTLNMDDYVKGVLPHEWISSWQAESLRAGAVAIRSYASYWVLKGGKYSCADLCDTTYSQVYKPSTLPVTNQAVDATKQQVMMKNSTVPCTEYSAENSTYPTWESVKVDDSATCAGKTLYGHGRGMCQWGSQRWALQGKKYDWIALHYYPGASLWVPPTTPDQGVPKPDQGTPPKPDQGSPPKKDQGSPPKKDQGAPPKPDQGAPPKPDQGQAGKDRGAPKKDGYQPKGDLPGRPPEGGALALYTLSGGCSLDDAGARKGGSGALPGLLLLLWVILRVRRKR